MNGRMEREKEEGKRKVDLHDVRMNEGEGGNKNKRRAARGQSFMLAKPPCFARCLIINRRCDFRYGSLSLQWSTKIWRLLSAMKSPYHTREYRKARALSSRTQEYNRSPALVFSTSFDGAKVEHVSSFLFSRKALFSPPLSLSLSRSHIFRKNK